MTRRYTPAQILATISMGTGGLLAGIIPVFYRNQTTMATVAIMSVLLVVIPFGLWFTEPYFETRRRKRKNMTLQKHRLQVLEYGGFSLKEHESGDWYLCQSDGARLLRLSYPADLETVSTLLQEALKKPEPKPE